ncbi:MAG: hypothetical protein Q8Q60_00505 [Candidatus Chromulinivorax sp.]|nr:hypothetical protein [Candidatus Chromulinivorax sp.]
MQKNHLMLLCMVLSIHSSLQLANDIQPHKNKAGQSKQISTKTTTDVDQKSTDKVISGTTIIQPAVPAVNPIFELPQLITAPSQDQNLDLFHYFMRDVNFSKDGITHYFKYIYNHEKYTEYLPYNFSHMIQFLEFGQTNNQSEAYAKSIIKLFLQKIKGCDFINSYSMITAMPKLADALSPYMVKKEATFLQELQKSLKARFSNIFSTYYSYFQKNPDAFLEALSEQIAKKTNEVQTQQHVDVEQIRKDILRFLETCISKLVWSSQDAYEAWTAINELATQTEQFLDKKLLSDVDAFDDICWSLIHRFCYFIDISAEDIPQEIFMQIVNDIHNEKLILLEIEEQENIMTSKKNYLLKKIKNYCPYVYPTTTKEYKIYTAQTVLDSAS